ncbi:hypothetical protein THITH_11005 [Thioalkalivibrio paradoxus ARh 1]|uniref:Uncharacterized protein n=1 Tax=Thioalkalivibrio paradoxus ARh 1 TaxID=713585 RepID=W0DNM5_9GAMM|nr:hypothetical protein THITH_11005 [Thioalkalivibrio paradoxus ARh 1]
MPVDDALTHPVNTDPAALSVAAIPNTPAQR